MFVKLAAIEDSDQFREACASMGWEGDDWREVFDELKEYSDAFIANYDIAKANLKNIKTATMADVFVTSANRWYTLNVPVFINAQGVWATEQSVSEF